MRNQLICGRANFRRNMHVFEDDQLSQMEFENYAQAYESVDNYMRWYNNTRIHSSIHYLTPVEFHRAHIETGLQPKKPILV
ncbi:hypothetical protein D2Q93_16720 [Alicyclobacillaceae bacterium I2511]|nr:hypothetical protein D2Q93_16720 [Alicyclobacillaceae bacterium I2511]